MNDPRITSYALGELAGRERDDFERELAASEDLQRELNEIIRLVESLDNLPMPTETLTDESRDALRSECAANQLVRKRRKQIVRGLVAGGALAAAACLLLLISLPESPRKSNEVASARQADSVPAKQEPLQPSAAPPAALLASNT